MSAKHLRNISISKWKAFLELALCKYIGTVGGHEKWTRSDILRPIIFQTHIDPIPEFIIKNNLRNLNYTKKDFFEIIEGKKIVIKQADKYIFKNR